MAHATIIQGVIGGVRVANATIIQRVNCIFGDDHKITVEIGDDNTLGNVTTSCSADKEETQGLILLGTDPMKTCLGYMDTFVKHATAQVTYNYSHNPHPDYAGTVLYLAAEPIASQIQKKKEKRQQLAKEVSNAENQQKSNNLVSRRLQEVMKKALARYNDASFRETCANAFRVLQEKDGRYTFNLALDRQYNYQTSSYDPREYIAVADRVDGSWNLREDWEHGGKIYRRTGSWGGSCVTCQRDGNRHHDGTNGHRKELVKKLFLAMQATSSEGMKIVLNDVTDEDGEPFEFKYRANQKKFIGVRLPDGVKPRPSY